MLQEKEDNIVSSDILEVEVRQRRALALSMAAQGTVLKARIAETKQTLALSLATKQVILGCIETLQEANEKLNMTLKLPM